MKDKCDNATTLTVDLFSDGKLYKSAVKLPLVYEENRAGLGKVSDLLDAGRLALSPTTQKMMGRVYIGDSRPSDVSNIEWFRYGTYVTSGQSPSYLVSCAGVLGLQKKYVALNLSPAPQDETLKMDVYWRGKLIKEDYALPIRYVHGERVFGESRLDLVEAVREAIPPDLLLDYDVTLQFMNRRAKPSAQPINWKERKPGVLRLMAKWPQIKMLQRQWVAVNVEPQTTVVGLRCDACCLFDAVFQDNESKLFYCSKQCYLDNDT